LLDAEFELGLDFWVKEFPSLFLEEVAVERFA
jgi:hypothetical protein